MQKKFTFLYVVFFSACSVNLFSQNWQTYPYSPANSFLNFQEDDGYHSALNTSTEWWYINMHLIGSAPAYKKYSVMLCYFRFANMRIFNIACESDNTYKNDVLQAYPVFVPQQGHWEFTYTTPFPTIRNDYSRWTYPQDGKPYSYIYHAEDPVNNNGLDITVVGNRPPLVVGGCGYIALGDQGDSSYYYSYTNMKVTGTLKYNGVTDNITSGVAWIDRQYGPFTVGTNPNNLYEWFSMQLDNPGTTLGQPQAPSEYNIWQIFSDSCSVPYSPEWRLVSAIYPDDSQDTSSSYIFERTGYWFDASKNKYYSQGWRFINPAKDITVDLIPQVKDQIVDVTFFRFWEGGVHLKGVFQNKNVDGVGFAEIVAGRSFQINVPSVPAGLTATTFADHHSLSWQASTAGTYPIGGYRVFRSATNDGHWKFLATTTNLSYNDFSADMDSVYYYTVTSFDNMTATSASEYAPFVWAAPLGVKDFKIPDSGFQIYPNPNDGKFQLVRGSGIRQSGNIKIYNVFGEEVFKSEFASGGLKSEINISNQPKGIYLLKISAGEESGYRKLVITK